MSAATTGAEIVEGPDGGLYMIAELDAETHLQVSQVARLLGLTVEQTVSMIVNDSIRKMAEADPGFRTVDLREYRAARRRA